MINRFMRKLPCVDLGQTTSLPVTNTDWRYDAVACCG